MVQTRSGKSESDASQQENGADEELRREMTEEQRGYGITSATGVRKPNASGSRNAIIESSHRETSQELRRPDTTSMRSGGQPDASGSEPEIQQTPRTETSQERRNRQAREKELIDEAWHYYDIIVGSTTRPASNIANDVRVDRQDPPCRELLEFLDPETADLRNAIKLLAQHLVETSQPNKERLESLDSANIIPQRMIATWQSQAALVASKSRLRDRLLQAFEHTQIVRPWGNPLHGSVESNVRM